MAYEGIGAMLNETITKLEQTGDEVSFEMASGRRFKMNHHQDCCESVGLVDVIGDTADLIGSPLLMAEAIDSEPPARGPDDYVPESETWTFYKLGTAKGYVTFRWQGTSNGYYSEGVDVDEL